MRKKGEGEEEKKEVRQGMRDAGGRRTATVMRRREKQKRTRIKYAL